MNNDNFDIWSDYNVADTMQSIKARSILELYTDEAYNRKVMTLLNDTIKKGDRVLDIGCGIGKWVLYLLENGVDCIGVDSSEIAVEKAKQIIRDYTQETIIFKNQATDLPFERNQFDAIISFGLLEHFPNHEDVLKYWTEFLRPGGKIIISVPNGLRWDWMFADVLFKWYKQKSCLKMKITRRGFISTNYGYEERWLPSYFRKILKRAAFKKIKLTTFFTLSPLLFYSLGKRNMPRTIFHLLSSTKASQRWGLYLFGVGQK